MCLRDTFPQRWMDVIERGITRAPKIDGAEDIEVLSTPRYPGDMLVWRSYNFHSTPGNTLSIRRATFSVNWLGDDINYVEILALAIYLDPGLKNGVRAISDKFHLIMGSIGQG